MASLCPICKGALTVSFDRIEGTTCEETEECKNEGCGLWQYDFSYGMTEWRIGQVGEFAQVFGYSWTASEDEKCEVRNNVDIAVFELMSKLGK